MIGYGPTLVVQQLKESLDRLPVQASVSELERYKEKLDQYHRHIFLSTAFSKDSFCVFSAIDTAGRRVVGLSISDPFEKNLVIYSSPIEHDVLNTVYKNVFGKGVQFFKSGIVRLPFQYKVIAVVGDDDFVQREILKEKVYGIQNLSFSQSIDQEYFDKLCRLNQKKVDFAVIYPLDEYIVCILTMPEHIDKDYAPLLSEISRIYKRKYGPAYQGNVERIKRLNSVLSAFVVSYENFLKGFDIEKNCLELCQKIKKAYKCVIDLS